MSIRLSLVLMLAAAIHLINPMAVRSARPPESDDQMIQRALKASGMTAQIAAFSDALLAAIPMDAFPDDRARKEARSFLAAALGEDKLLPMLHESFKESLNKDYLQKVLEFHQSRLGKKVGQLAENTLSPSSLETMREQRHFSRTLDKERLEILERIVRSERTTELNLSLLNALFDGLAEGTLAASPSQADRVSELRHRLRSIEAEMKQEAPRTMEMAVSVFAYTYRQLKDSELGELASYLESEPAAWYREVLQRGTTQAVRRAGVTLGELMAQLRERSGGEGPVPPKQNKKK
ncbi:MAG: hypothetical protein AB1664_18395 [Thermodesulfobacteriota bacterium]